MTSMIASLVSLIFGLAAFVVTYVLASLAIDWTRQYRAIRREIERMKGDL